MKPPDMTNPSFRPLWVALGALTCLFHIGLIFYGLVPNLVARPLHMALILPWVFVFAATTPLGRASGALVVNGARKSTPCAAQRSSTPRMRVRLSSIGIRRRAPWAAMLT